MNQIAKQLKEKNIAEYLIYMLARERPDPRQSW